MMPIVIAEDDVDIAAVMVDALASDGTMDPTLVTNGALVIDAIMHTGARLLVLDVQMPGATGIDVFDVVRGHPAFRHLPVLFVTANPELALETLQGVAPRDVLAKPFDLDELIARAHSLIVEARAA